jgi:hypothetical protein
MKQILSFITSLTKLKQDQSNSGYDMKKQSQMAELDKQETESPQRFQWIKGDNFGEIVTLEKEEKDFLIFTNGERIFKSMQGEFLMKIEGDDIPLPGLETAIFNKGVDVPQGAQNSSLNLAAENSPQKSPLKSSPKTPEETPLEKLILKLSQKNIENVNIQININIPKKEVVDMLVENSDEDRTTIMDSITKMAITQISIDNLQEYLKEQINSHIKNYYNE